MDNNGGSLLKCGKWIWDDQNGRLLFLSRDIINIASQSTSKTKVVGQPMPGEMKFKETVSSLEKVKFKRRFQRKVKAMDPSVVTIQDVKDVALYLAYGRDLSIEFINYYHLPTMDRFLRTLVIYFQYYLQVWENLMARREEAKKKIYQPLVTVLEDIVRDDLSDLRSMVAREYGCILTGTGETKKYHHMLSNKNNVSLSDKDRRLFEIFICVTARVIWVALNRKNLNLIVIDENYLNMYSLLLEVELNRLLRSDLFNLKTRQGTHKKVTPEEIRILAGLANTSEIKLLTRSPLTKEILLSDHDHRMLVIGLKDFSPKDQRLKYMEAAFSAPEELLIENGITVGILGLPRKLFDGVLIPKVQPKKKMQKAKEMEAPPFKLPSVVQQRADKIEFKFQEKPPIYTETTQTMAARQKQKLLWLKHVEKALEIRDMSVLDLTLQSESQLGLITSLSSLSIGTKGSLKN